MKTTGAWGLALAAWLAGPGSPSRADPVLSTTGLEGAGTLRGVFTCRHTGPWVLALRNTSPAAGGDHLTAFAFNHPAGRVASLLFAGDGLDFFLGPGHAAAGLDPGAFPAGNGSGGGSAGHPGEGAAAGGGGTGGGAGDGGHPGLASAAGGGLGGASSAPLLGGPVLLRPASSFSEPSLPGGAGPGPVVLDVSGSGPGPAVRAIPEPSALLLAAVAGAGGAALCWRHRRRG